MTILDDIYDVALSRPITIPRPPWASSTRPTTSCRLASGTSSDRLPEALAYTPPWPATSYRPRPTRRSTRSARTPAPSIIADLVAMLAVALDLPGSKVR